MRTRYNTRRSNTCLTCFTFGIASSAKSVLCERRRKKLFGKKIRGREGTRRDGHGDAGRTIVVRNFPQRSPSPAISLATHEIPIINVRRPITTRFYLRTTDNCNGPTETRSCRPRRSRLPNEAICGRSVGGDLSIGNPPRQGRPQRKARGGRCPPGIFRCSHIMT